jgi:hypothetical protein
MSPSTRRGPSRRRTPQIGRSGFIHAFGLFWNADEIDWSPGAGRDGQFRMLGRVGSARPRLRVCDFRPQRGIYILYDDYGPYYVGLVRDQPLGNRLRTHRRDRHAGNWDRFSWFGFRRVQEGQLRGGTRTLGAVPERLLSNSDKMIGDIEALLIQSLGTQKRANIVQMRFSQAEHWDQVMAHETDFYLGRLDRPQRLRHPKR